MPHAARAKNKGRGRQKCRPALLICTRSCSSGMQSPYRKGACPFRPARNSPSGRHLTHRLLLCSAARGQGVGRRLLLYRFCARGARGQPAVRREGRFWACGPAAAAMLLRRLSTSVLMRFCSRGSSIK